MPTDALDRLERLFRAALLHPPEERADFLDAACDDAALRAEVESLLAADADAASGDFLDPPATGLLGDASGPTAPLRPRCARGPVGGALPGAPAPREGRDGRRLPRRPRGAVPPPRRAEGDPRERPRARGAAPVRAGAADPRLARPPRHRPPPRRRRDGGRPPVLRDGVRRRTAADGVLRRAPARHRRAAGAVPLRLRGGPLRAPEPRPPPRRQAVQHPRDGLWRGEAARFRHRQAAQPEPQPDRYAGDADGAPRDDAGVRQPRAGPRRGAHRRPATCTASASSSTSFWRATGRTGSRAARRTRWCER